jgi:hypothetical protein
VGVADVTAELWSSGPSVPAAAAAVAGGAGVTVAGTPLLLPASPAGASELFVEQQEQLEQRHQKVIKGLTDEVGAAKRQLSALSSHLDRATAEAGILSDMGMTSLDDLEQDLEEALGRVRSEKRERTRQLHSQRELELEQRLCKVCMETEKDTVLIPCGHRCLCFGCAELVSATAAGSDSSQPDRLCPICRIEWTSMLRTFDS